METQPAERITANDEERLRQGFEIQTVFSWPVRDGRLDVETAVASDANGPILRIDYAPGALVSRINKGLRRRKEKSILGFGIEPATGRWTKGPDDDGNDNADQPGAQRVVPIVQDNKNAILIRLAGEPGAEQVMTTLQHALARGLEVVFQLEEGETLSEPTPSRDNRRAILAFEASEGGAGVLGRLANEPGNLSRVALAALDIMHLENVEAAIIAADPDLLKEKEGSNCVKGCYRCLLSYYNQPDHELIDRANKEVRRILLRLARSAVKTAASKPSANGAWAEALARWKLPATDAAPLSVGELSLPLVWRSHLVAAATRPLIETDRSMIAHMGFTVIEVSAEPGVDVPTELAALLGHAS